LPTTLSLVRDEVAVAAAKVDEQQVADLAHHLCRHSRVFVAGAGRSGLVLRMFAMRPDRPHWDAARIQCLLAPARRTRDESDDGATWPHYRRNDAAIAPHCTASVQLC
jgi:hypothetical protein